MRSQGRKRVRIFFTDFWPGFEKQNYFLDFLDKYYDVVVDAKPDYLFYSVYGQRHLKYNECIKICFTGENIVPDFNQCDYALGFHYLDFADRYLRFPLYLIYPNFRLLQNKAVLDSRALTSRKFCNFIYSNSKYADPIREAFFIELSKYKKVDAGGRHLNNLGYNVTNKVEFIKSYKFTIAFENSSTAGYTTEKLTEPLLSNSIPIYWGNPLVQLEFNERSMINVNRYDSIGEAIEEVIRLDNNDDEYLDKIYTAPLLDHAAVETWGTRLLDFFERIFHQDMTDARRRPRFGFSKYDFEERLIQADLLARRRNLNRYKSKLLQIFRTDF